MNIRHVAPATLLALASVNSSALDIEPYWGFGLSGDPIGGGLAKYTYTDGDTRTLVAGKGLGILIGSDLFSVGPFEFNIKGGFQYTNMSGTTAIDKKKRTDTFRYFPVFANVSYDLGNRFIISGGVSYLISPTYKLTIGDDDLSVDGDNSLGFNAELKYVAIESTLESNFEAFYVLRYAHNDITYDSYTENGVTEKLTKEEEEEEEVRSLQLGLTLRY